MATIMWKNLDANSITLHISKKTDLFSFILPESMTYTTSSMVTDVSAILVEMMIFVTPSGGRLKTACCSSLDKDE